MMVCGARPSEAPRRRTAAVGLAEAREAEVAQLERRARGVGVPGGRGDARRWSWRRSRRVVATVEEVVVC